MVAQNKLGLIVNPVAGLGGAVGLKGTDGLELLERAEALGAVPQAQNRSRKTLAVLSSMRDSLEIFTFGDSMGEAVAVACGFTPTVIGSGSFPRTTSVDTAEAARKMAVEPVDLLLFAGGDGTARDIHDTVGTSVTTLGIPAGVKIQSAVFATSPAAAGRVAEAYLSGNIKREREAEVVDIDEDEYRREILSSRLHGYLKIPAGHRLLQGTKTASAPDEQSAQVAIATELIDHLKEDHVYVVGPGTTCRTFLDTLGVECSLLGVDLMRARRLLAKDASEREIVDTVRAAPCSIVLTPIGGQGFLLGRGNQQISPAVIRRAGRNGIVIVATADKLSSLGGRPLLVDTGDSELDSQLSGYHRVITGYRENTVYRVSDCS
jgi:predicted polyphosphate/ATP-dependent NAD kinase